MTAIPRRRGYSLTELMLVVAILGVISSTGPFLMIQLQNFFLMTTARAEIQRDARAALDLMHRTLRQAKLNTITIDSPSGQAPYSRIRFTRADGAEMEFRQSGSKLIARKGLTENALSSNLLYIAFTFPRTDDPALISVSLTMGKNIQLGRRKVLELTVQKIRIMNP